MADLAIIEVVVGSPDRGLRHRLRNGLRHPPGIRVLGDTGEPERLQLLVATRMPSVVVLDARWQDYADLIQGLAARPSTPRLVLCVDRMDTPDVLAAIQLGVQGCVPRDMPPETWRKAIAAVDAGDPWIPRRLLSAALAGLQPFHRRPPPCSIEQRLTERQCEIVHWVAQGLSNKEIGRRLGISPTTVKTHLHNIFERVGVSGRQRLSLHAGAQRVAA